MNKNLTSINDYSKRKEKRVELQCRLSMGIWQLKHKPYSIVPLLLLCILFIFAWCNKDRLLPIQFIPQMFLPICQYIIALLLIAAFVLSILVIIRQLGIGASISIESKLIMAFDARDLRENGYPVLKSYMHDREANLKTAVFYSHIPLPRWKEKREEIEEETGMFIQSIDYLVSGQKSNYKKIVFLCGKRRKDLELHDEKLDRELINVD